MITLVECRERSAECRAMAKSAPNPRVQAILIDMARTWTRLALEAERLSEKGQPDRSGTILPWTR
jgi:hypothetical protein